MMRTRTAAQEIDLMIEDSENQDDIKKLRDVKNLILSK